MPFVPRLFIRTAFAWFAVGFVWAAAITLIKVADRTELRHAFITAHAHILLVGFFTNVVMGVAFWMFPRPPDRRMNETLATVAYVLLNLGLLMRIVFEWAQEEYQYQVYGFLLGTSGVLQALGGLVFACVIWPRVRAARIPQHLQSPDASGRRGGGSPPPS
jgi:heme/copper-type cytochrome/quinol oxidase subunit 1